MSESSVPVRSPLISPSLSEAQHYQLSDDLARLCLPQEFKDSYRRLAWVNSVCALFLLIGLVGLKAPKVVVKPLSTPVETVAVILTPPEEQPKTEPEVKPNDTEQPQDTQVDTPQVVTVVAAADAPNVAFAVPVQGAVAVAAAANLASPPPAITHAPPPRPVKFNPNTTDGGTYPDPRYPSAALRNRIQGTVTIDIVVDESGNVTAAKVATTSGSSMLDDEALETVKRRWHFPPGPPRLYYWQCSFKLQ